MRAAVAAGVAVIMAFLAVPTAAAAAEPDFPIFGQVTLQGQTSSRGVDVYIEIYEKLFYLDTTDSSGRWYFLGREDMSDNHFVFIDSAHQYSSVEDYGGANNGQSLDMGNVEMHLGGVVMGHVLAPSGHPLKNAHVTYAQWGKQDWEWQDNVDDTTTADGLFVLAPLDGAAFVPTVTIGGVVYPSTEPFVRPPFAASGPDGVPTATDQDLTGIKAPVTVSFTGTSPARHKATLKVSVSAATYGLSGPGGKVTVYDGAKAVKSNVTLSATGKATINLSGLKHARHSFKVKFLGATDTLPKTSSTHKVAVK